MAFVHGDSESVRRLQQVFELTMRAIEQDTEKLEKLKRAILDAWNDEGAAEVEEIVTQIRSALKAAAESRNAVNQALGAYAEFLEETK